MTDRSIMIVCPYCTQTVRIIDTRPTAVDKLRNRLWAWLREFFNPPWIEAHRIPLGDGMEVWCSMSDREVACFPEEPGGAVALEGPYR